MSSACALSHAQRAHDTAAAGAAHGDARSRLQDDHELAALELVEPLDAGEIHERAPVRTDELLPEPLLEFLRGRELKLLLDVACLRCG